MWQERQKQKDYHYFERIILQFQELLQYAFWTGLLPDHSIHTGLYRPWGEKGAEVECYGVDLDSVYESTPFRYENWFT